MRPPLVFHVSLASLVILLLIFSPWKDYENKVRVSNAATIEALTGDVSPLPPDSPGVEATKQLAARSYTDADQTFDYDKFNYTVVNNKVSSQGYPIYLVECNFETDRNCVGESGQPLGSIDEVAENMSRVSNVDVLRAGWKCDQICMDSTGAVVGSVDPAMQKWLYRNKHP